MIRLVIRKMRGILGRLRRRCGKRRKRVAESTRWFWRIEGPISPMRKQRLQRRDQYRSTIEIGNLRQSRVVIDHSGSHLPQIRQ